MGFWKRFKSIFNENLYQEVIKQHVKEFLSGDDLKILSSQNAIPTKLSTVFCCMRVRSETFASVPVVEYKKLENGDREQTDDTGLYTMLHKNPNDNTTSYAFHESMLNNMMSGGNAIAIRNFNFYGNTTGLIQVPWDRVNISQNKETKNIEYEIDYYKTYRRDEIFHVPGFSMNGIIGMSILEQASICINLGLTLDTFQNKFFKNGAITSGVFETDEVLSQEAFDKMRDALLKSNSGLETVGKPMVLDSGLKFKPVTMKLLDAQVIESKNINNLDICRFFRVPPHMIYDLTRATFSNIEHQSIEFVLYSILPDCKRFEQAINSQLLPDNFDKNGYYFEYNLSGLVRGDLKSRYEAYATARQNGWLSVNDIRRLENLPKIKNGDIYLQPVNMVEAGKDPYNENKNKNNLDIENIKDIERILNATK